MMMMIPLYIFILNYFMGGGVRTIRAGQGIRGQPPLVIRGKSWRYGEDHSKAKQPRVSH